MKIYWNNKPGNMKTKDKKYPPPLFSTTTFVILMKKFKKKMMAPTKNTEVDDSSC